MKAHIYTHTLIHTQMHRCRCTHQHLHGCRWPYQQGPGPPPDVVPYPAPTPQACDTLHCTLHIHFCTLALLFCIVVLIVFVCFTFTVCTYTPEQIPGRCKPTWQYILD